MYQTRRPALLSDMETRTPLSTPFPGAVQVDYRAVRPAEIREVDLDSGAVPAFVLLTNEEWQSAVAPFTGQGPVLDGGRGGPLLGPPGWSIWAQLASRSGDVIVGGRDRVGFPAIPVAHPDGAIGFESLVPGAVSTTPLGEVDPLEKACRPVLSPEGPIVCVSPGCDDCLRAATLTTWYSMVACMCRRTGATHG